MHFQPTFAIVVERQGCDEGHAAWPGILDYDLRVFKRKVHGVGSGPTLPDDGEVSLAIIKHDLEFAFGVRALQLDGVDFMPCPKFQFLKYDAQGTGCACVNPIKITAHDFICLPSFVAFALWRSEERRVGKECRSRGAPYH